MDQKKILEFVEAEWKASIYDKICEYIRIPNQSPMFDREWATNGHLDRAAELLANWAADQKIIGFSQRIVREADKTPLIFITIESTLPDAETVLMYGHLDKQPPMEKAWSEGLGPFTPVLKEGKLYGRGGADDGYAIFAAICALKALQTNEIPHGRIVVIVEACEESGSKDLPFYMEKLAPELGEPSLVICLDSGCGNYEQLWLTTSLRGMIAAELKVAVTSEGQHSGNASGIVPSSFRIMRQLLDRLEDSKSGRVILPELNSKIPDHELVHARATAETLGDQVYTNFAWLPGVKPVDADITDMILHRTWRPTICYTGLDGIPKLEDAGNVLRTHTTVTLSIRIPPTCQPAPAEAALVKCLEAEPPNGAHVSLKINKSAAGWTAPKLSPWLEKAVNEASMGAYGKPARLLGEGGSIPFMGMLGALFPKTQFVIVGVLGPGSNAHGPNEFLHIEMAQRVTACVAHVVAKHAEKRSSVEEVGVEVVEGVEKVEKNGKRKAEEMEECVEQNGQNGAKKAKVAQ